MKQILIILFSATILVSIWFRNGNLLGSAESALPFYDLRNNYEQTSWSWSPTVTGFETGTITASAPTYYLLYNLQDLGISGFILEILVFWIILVVSGISIYLLSKELFPNVGSLYHLVVVYLYWFSPLSLVNVWNRFLYNHMAFFAFLPLVLLLFLRGFNKKDHRFSFWIGVSSFVFSYALTSLPFNIVLWLIFTYTLTFYFWISKYWKDKRFYILFYLSTLLLYAIINSWWLTQLFSFVSSSSFDSSVSKFHSEIDSRYELSSLSERLGLLINITRLTHGTFIFEPIPWLKLLQVPVLNIIQFMPITIMIYAIYKFTKEKSVLYLSGLLFLSLFLMKGDNPPLGEIFSFTYNNFVFMRIFRNAFEKFGFMLPLTLPLVALGLHELNKKFKPKTKKLIAWLILLVTVSYWGYPFWTGVLFTRTDFNQGSSVSYEVKVPDEYKTINNWFNQSNESFRFVTLPIRSEGITYTWEKSYAGVDLTSSLFDRASISHNTTIPYYSDVVSELYNKHTNEDVLNFFPFLNAKYILFRSDIDYKERKMTDPLVMKGYLEDWQKKGLIRKEVEEGNLAAYSINENYHWPKIYLTPNLIHSNINDLSKASEYLEGFPTQTTAVLTDTDSSLTRNRILKPDSVYSPKILQSMRSMYDQDLLAQLLYVKHLPGSLIYPAVLLKEKIEFPSASGYYTLGSYQSAIVGKRAVEIYKLRSTDADLDTIKKAEARYLLEFNRLVAILKGIYKDTINIPDSITIPAIIQIVLLERVNSPVAGEVTEMLKELKSLPRYNLPEVVGGNYFVTRFVLKEDGEYYLNGSKVKNSNKWFLDGKEVQVTEDEADIKLEKVTMSKGEHEFATSININDVMEQVVDKSLDIQVIDINNPYLITNIQSNHEFIYEVSFDYLFIGSGKGKIAYFQDIDHHTNPVFKQDIDNSLNWRNYRAQFTTLPGSVKGNIIIEIENLGSLTPSQLNIKGLQVKRFNYPQLELSSLNQPISGKTTSTWEWVMINPTKYLLKVNKGDNKKEVIVLSELFNSSWILKQGNYDHLWGKTKLIKDWGDKGKEYLFEGDDPLTISGDAAVMNEHILVNGMSNGWVLDKQGTYSYVIEYAAQKPLVIGRIVSQLSLGLVIAYLLIQYLWKRPSN